MPIVGGLDIHRKQITFDYLDTETGQVKRGQVAPADRAHLRAWLARFAGRNDVAFALEGCTGWRYVALRREALFVRVEVRDRIRGLCVEFPVQDRGGAKFCGRGVPDS